MSVAGSITSSPASPCRGMAPLPAGPAPRSTKPGAALRTTARRSVLARRAFYSCGPSCVAIPAPGRCGLARSELRCGGTNVGPKLPSRTRCSRSPAPRAALPDTVRAARRPAPAPSSPLLPTADAPNQRAPCGSARTAERASIDDVSKIDLSCRADSDFSSVHNATRLSPVGSRSGARLRASSRMARHSSRSAGTSSGGVLMVSATRPDVRSRPSSN